MSLGESIKSGHDEYRRIFAKLFKSGDSETDLRKSLFLDYATKLYAHHEAEAATVIPAMLKVSDFKGIGYELLEEHATMKLLIKDLKEMGYGQPMWKYRLSPLYDVMKVHWDKEETQVIPFAPEYFPASALDDLAKKFDSLVAKYMKEH